ALDRDAVGLAERDMTGGVLVEERLVEQYAGLGDGAGGRHQRDLTEALGALVGGQYLVEGLLPLAGPSLDDRATLEAEFEVVDDGAVISQGFGGANHAVNPGSMRRREHLFGRHVGHE